MGYFFLFVFFSFFSGSTPSIFFSMSVNEVVQNIALLDFVKSTKTGSLFKLQLLVIWLSHPWLSMYENQLSVSFDMIFFHLSMLTSIDTSAMFRLLPAYLALIESNSFLACNARSPAHEAQTHTTR